MNDLFSPSLLPGSSWLRRPAHRLWLAAEGRRLLDFAKAARVPQGFAPLDHFGNLDDEPVADGILTARMVHAFSLAALQGLPGCRTAAEHGVRALLGPLRDHVNDGWLTSAAAPQDRKQAYLHAFVALAGSSAATARIVGGAELLDASVAVLDRHFWSEEEGVMRESFAPDWSDEENYRGANANMHSTEACLALADSTGDRIWLKRAERIVTRFVHDIASRHDFTIPEHFDRDWKLLRDYNQDKPTDALRPYGMTPGHFAEWSHLTLKVEAALLRAEGQAPDWLLHDARALFRNAMTFGWNADGAPGIVYTIDWEKRAHVPVRAHWVHAEAATAAVNLLKRTGHAEYETWYRTIWDYIDSTLIDREQGSWLNEVDREGRLSKEVYPDKADLYHAYQSTIAPFLPLAPSLAQALVESDAV